MVGLVPLLLKSYSASLLLEDSAACLELRSEGCQLRENNSDDPGVLIMQRGQCYSRDTILHIQVRFHSTYDGDGDEDEAEDEEEDEI
ncbi:hypothetical protein Tco_1014017 [Tanacetum coccineum]